MLSRDPKSVWLWYLQPVALAAAFPFLLKFNPLAVSLMPFFFFVLHPLEDLLLGRFALVETKTPRGPASVWYEVPIYLWAIVQTALLVWTLNYQGELAGSEAAILALSVGLLTGGFGITVSHELVHRRTRWKRGLGVFLLTQVLYPHFRIAHVFWHHKYVATPQDPATARRGESVYAFWFRSGWGNLRVALAFEANRLRSKRLSVWHPSNRCLQYALVTAVYLGVVAVYFGPRGILFVFLQSAVGYMLLETIDYIEHYGLVRAVDTAGRYEPISARSSWDSPHRATNYYLFNLGHHADHHLEPSEPYERIRPLTEAGRLPAGYSAMVLLALVPPLWHSIIGKALLNQNGSSAA